MVGMDKVRQLIEHLAKTEKQIRFRINSHDHIAPNGRSLKIRLPGDEPEITEGLQVLVYNHLQIEMTTIDGKTIEIMTTGFEIIGETEHYIELWTTRAISIVRKF